MVWLHGGYTGLDKDGNDALLNFMPRSLRWYIWVCKYKLYIYISAGMLILLGAFCLGTACYSYKTYIEQVARYEQIQDDEKSNDVRQHYHTIQEKISQLLKSHEQINEQSTLVILLDGAMITKGNLSIRHIEFSDEGFSVDGSATNENVYHSYIQYVQSHMKKVTFDGKQQVEKAEGICSFHLEGHTKQHDAPTKESNSDV